MPVKPRAPAINETTRNKIAHFSTAVLRRPKLDYNLVPRDVVPSNPFSPRRVILRSVCWSERGNALTHLPTASA
jgi:hypothetical protein